MKLQIVTGFVLLSLALASCSAQWTRPETTPEQMSGDLDTCKDAAMEEYPVASSRALPNYQSQNSVGCAGADCRAKPGSTLSEPAQDLNRPARDKAVIYCMENEGYKQP